MPWALTGIVSVGIIALSGFWVIIIIWNYAVSERVAIVDFWLGVAGIVLALAHVALHAVAVFLRREWAASTVVNLLALEGLFITAACFPPAMILVGLAVFTFTMLFAMCYWRYKAFNYPSLFILLGLFEGR